MSLSTTLGPSPRGAAIGTEHSLGRSEPTANQEWCWVVHTHSKHPQSLPAFSPQHVLQQHPPSPEASPHPPPVVPLVDTEGKAKHTAHQAATSSFCRTTGKRNHQFPESHLKPAGCLMLREPRVSLTGAAHVHPWQCSCRAGCGAPHRTQPDSQTFSSSRQHI